VEQNAQARRWRFSKYALLARDETPPDSWLAGRNDGSLGLLRVEFHYGLAADETFSTSARRYLELSELPIVPLVDGGADADRGFFVRRLPGGIHLRALGRRMRVESGTMPASLAAALGVELARVLRAVRDTDLESRWLDPLGLGLDWNAQPWLDLPSILPSPGDPGPLRPMIDVMSPEDIRGEPAAEPAWVYRLAALLRVVWTGRPLVSADDVISQLRRHVSGDLDPFVVDQDDDAARELIAVLEGCLSTRPGERPGQLRAVEDRLATIAAPAQALAGFLATLFSNERLAEERMREEIELLTPELVDSWPAVSAVPALPASTSRPVRPRPWDRFVRWGLGR
jgi:hypothetical protein